MNVRRVERQVLAILDSNGLRYSHSGNEYALRFSSALVLVGFSRFGSQVIITLRAPVLLDVVSDPRNPGILGELNRRNCESHFGKWAYYEDEQIIALEYDLLGDHLQEEELMMAVATIGRLADQSDDALKRKLRIGRRAFEGDS